MTDLIPIDTIDGDRIRRVWHDEEWYYSIIDIIAVLLDVDYKNAQNSYHVLKNKLNTEGNKTLNLVKKLKMVAKDGKSRLTDCVNAEQILRIIQSINSPKVEPFKLWLAQVGSERLQETDDPELGLFRSLERASEKYRLAGKTDSWITVRVEGIITRNAFVKALSEAVLDAPDSLFGLTTDNLYKGLWERTTAQLRQELGIKKRDNPRDHFGEYALIYTRLAEKVSTERLENLETVPMSVAMEIVWQVAKLFHTQAKALSEALGYDLVTEKPLLSEGRRKPPIK